jgi:hypothetical protein
MKTTYRIEEKTNGDWIVASGDTSDKVQDITSKKQAIKTAKQYAKDFNVKTRIVDNNRPNFPIYLA